MSEVLCRTATKKPPVSLWWGRTRRQRSRGCLGSGSAYMLGASLPWFCCTTSGLQGPECAYSMMHAFSCGVWSLPG